jgi:hypothetical protein
MSHFTSLTTGTTIAVNPFVQIVVYYERGSRSWWAYYIDAAGNQIGEAWYGSTRDEVLVQRPLTPEV